MDLPHTRFSSKVDRLVQTIVEGFSWIWLLLLGVIVINVVLRYLFGEGRVELEEVQWHLYALGFLLGLSYAYSHDRHIRVDVLRARFSPHIAAWIELYGTIFLLLPFIALIIFYALPFVWSSFELAERSQAPGGLAFRWLIKAALPLGFILLLATVAARLNRVWHFLFPKGKRHDN